MVKRFNSKAVVMFQKLSLLCFNASLSLVFNFYQFKLKKVLSLENDSVINMLKTLVSHLSTSPTLTKQLFLFKVASKKSMFLWSIILMKELRNLRSQNQCLTIITELRPISKFSARQYTNLESVYTGFTVKYFEIIKVCESNK